jgi:hypothetical protein
MSSTAGEGRDPIAAHARALPAAPSLEYERKEAKALLKQIHAAFRTLCGAAEMCRLKDL